MLNAKDDVLSPFIVKYIAVATGKDGKNYLNVILGDNSGELEARKWQEAEQTHQKIKVGDFVIVNGKVNAYQGRLQLIINEITKLNEGQYDVVDYIKKSSTAPEKMYDELLEIVSSLEEIYIKDLLLLVLNDYENKKRLLVWQAGKSIHHAYQSGLLEHILSCTKLALFLAPHYKVNRSYVVAGCVLHDLCKIYELTEGPVVDYTEEGKLIGHLVKGLEVVDHFASKIKNFPYAQKTHLKHILLSHHGEYEYGSPKIPHTSEAFLVHLIDLMDSKMSSMDQVKKNDNSTGNWTGMVKHLDRIVYKNELPSFTKYLEEGEDSKSNSQSQQGLDKNKKENAPTPKDLKQSLGSLLKDFKVD
jgi:3'-5' exoribonuclease